MPTVKVAELAFARAGDKGDTADLSLFAPDAEVYELLAAQVTADRVKDHVGRLVRGPVTRYDVPNVLALKFVCEQALGGGGPASLRADNLGKALGGALLHLTVEVPEAVAQRAAARSRPAADPYAGAAWVHDGRT
jgi:hypothetical protein